MVFRMRTTMLFPLLPLLAGCHETGHPTTAAEAWVTCVFLVGLFGVIGLIVWRVTK